MFSMTDGTRDRVPATTGLVVAEEVETVLAAVDARVRGLVTRHRVDELAIRRARRAGRRALRPAARFTMAALGGDAA